MSEPHGMHGCRARDGDHGRLQQRNPMPVHNVKTVMRWMIITVLVCAHLPLAPAAGLEDAPAVASYLGDRVAVTSSAGDRLTTVRGLSSFSLDGGLLVGATPRHQLVAFNARTGERRFTVPDGFQPTVLDRRGRVAFWATYARDRQVNSLWVREIDGRVRKVVQFANGEGLPGYDPGMGGDNTLLSTSFDQTGSKVALAQGNDVDLFVYDVFVVDVDTGKVRRITDDRRSRWPALQPHGRRVVYQRDVEPCDADHIRASRLYVESARGRNRRALTGGSCDRWFANARWVTPDAIVAYRTSRVRGELVTDLVMIDVATGERRKLTRSSDVIQFSAGEGRVAYSRAGVDGFTILDVVTGRTVVVGEGEIAHMAGDRTTL